MSDKNPANEKNRKEAERLMRQKIVEHRMESLINSTVDMDIKLIPGDEWAFDPKHKQIMYSTTGDHSIFNLTEEEVVAFILHEIGHANYTEHINPKGWPQPEDDYGTLMNCIEDIRVEKQLMDRYPGTYDSFRRTAVKIQSQLEEEFIAYVPNQINYLLNIRQHQWRFKLYFKNKGVEDLFLDTLFLIKKASNLKSIQALHDFISAELWPKYKQLLEEMEKEPGKGSSSQIIQQSTSPNTQNSSSQQSSSDNDSTQDSKEGQSNSSGGSDSKQENNQESDSKEQPKTEDQKKDEEYKENVKKKLSEAFKNKMPEMKELVDAIRDVSRNADQNKGKTLGQEIDEEIKNQEQRKTTAEQDNSKADKNVEISNKKSVREFKTYEELYADVQIYIPYFKMKLRSIMRDNEIRRFGGAFTRGKLNSKLLYKWKCKSSRIFSQKLHRMHKNYAVTLLVDESGSMSSYDKHINAVRAAVLLSEVLNAVKISFEIRGFNETERLYKSFNRPFNWTVKRNLENIIPSAAAGDNGNTNDAFAINWANHSLLQQDSERILIVLCDGEPNPSSAQIPTADYHRLKKVFHRYSDFSIETEIAKAKKNTLVVGVGIQSDSVAEHYEHNVICNTVSDLPTLVLGIIKKNIHRG